MREYSPKKSLSKELNKLKIDNAKKEQLLSEFDILSNFIIDVYLEEKK